MQKPSKEYLSQLNLSMFRLSLLSISAFSFYYLFNTSYIQKFLEEKQISVYYVQDVIMVLGIIIFSLSLFILILEYFLKNKFRFYNLLLSSILFILLGAYFATRYNYGSVARSEIGWFYKIPAGKPIGYPN